MPCFAELAQLVERWLPKPKVASSSLVFRSNALVLELVDNPDLGSGAVRCEGSSPSECTIADVEVGRDGAYLRTNV